MCRSIRFHHPSSSGSSRKILARNGETKGSETRHPGWSRQFPPQEVDAMKGQLKERGGTCRGREFPADGPKSTRRLQDESTEELERSIAGVEETNRKIRANLDKEKR